MDQGSPKHHEAVKVNLLGIGMSPELQLPVILLESEKDRSVLPIGIGFFEAGAIFAKLANREPPMALPHDLIEMVLERFDATVLWILIDEIQDDTFLSKIFIGTRDGEFCVDARPSDAIAVALRLKAPMYLSKWIMDEEGITPSEEKQELPKEGDPSEDVGQAEEVEREVWRPLSQLQADLARLIEREEYEQAAKVRDEMDRITSTKLYKHG